MARLARCIGTAPHPHPDHAHDSAGRPLFFTPTPPPPPTRAALRAIRAHPTLTHRCCICYSLSLHADRRVARHGRAPRRGEVRYFSGASELRPPVPSLRFACLAQPGARTPRPGASAGAATPRPVLKAVRAGVEGVARRRQAGFGLPRGRRKEGRGHGARDESDQLHPPSISISMSPHSRLPSLSLPSTFQRHDP